METKATPWLVVGPEQFTDRRGQLRGYGTRNLQHVILRVRAWRGRVARRDDDGKWEYDQCPHAHTKRGPANRCAEAAAKRLNKENR